MSRTRKYVNDAARAAAWRKRQRNAAAVAVPKGLKPFLQQLRTEITRRRAAIRCQRRRTQLTLPGPSGSEGFDITIELLKLLNYIECELDRTRVLAK